MDMLRGQQITDAGLHDWRKLGQGLHTRFIVADFTAGARFVTALATAAESAGHDPAEVRMGSRYVDVKLMSDDAVYRDDEGVDHRVDWVTQQDVDLARTISDIAAEHGAVADPTATVQVELALDTANPDKVAPVWAALLTGSGEAQGRGTLGEDVRDATGRVPILWFQDTEPHETPRQRFHLDIEVPYDAAEQRIAAALAAGGVIVDNADIASHTVIADPDGNKACIGTYQPAP